MEAWRAQYDHGLDMECARLKAEGVRFKAEFMENMEFAAWYLIDDAVHESPELKLALMADLGIDDEAKLVALMARVLLKHPEYLMEMLDGWLAQGGHPTFNEAQKRRVIYFLREGRWPT